MFYTDEFNKTLLTDTPKTPQGRCDVLVYTSGIHSCSESEQLMVQKAEKELGRNEGTGTLQVCERKGLSKESFDKRMDDPHRAF